MASSGSFRLLPLPAGDLEWLARSTLLVVECLSTIAAREPHGSSTDLPRHRRDEEIAAYRQRHLPSTTARFEDHGDGVARLLARQVDEADEPGMRVAASC